MKVEAKVSFISLLISFVLVFTSVLSMSGCSATYAPVEQRKASKSQKIKKYKGKTPPAYYRLKKGDTLFSIAWLYGLDYKYIAKINNIKKPYRIYSGDKIRLKKQTAKAKNHKPIL